MSRKRRDKPNVIKNILNGIVYCTEDNDGKYWVSLNGVDWLDVDEEPRPPEHGVNDYGNICKNFANPQFTPTSFADLSLDYYSKTGKTLEYWRVWC